MRRPGTSSTFTNLLPKLVTLCSFLRPLCMGASPGTPRSSAEALYRFAPATFAYGRSYVPTWPAEMIQGLSEAQAAVLEPPYAERLDRPLVTPAAEGRARLHQTRNEKKEFDSTSKHILRYFSGAPGCARAKAKARLPGESANGLGITSERVFKTESEATM